MVENLLELIHSVEGLQQAEYLRILNVYGLQSTKISTDSTRTRSWPGDSKNYHVQGIDAGSWHETCLGKIHAELLLPEQKEHHAAVLNDLIQTATKKPDFLKKVITGGKWAYGYDMEMKAHSFQWGSPGSPHQKKEWWSHNKIKTTLTVLFDWESIVHYKYTPPSQIINKK